ncbi:hypothetical protein [Photobacterium nomapromontoriensis]|uniref:hypothetical protein n=1 Tax=Photobacterium nomapromontoriensis TaxID=2910237 RepID=UPI003D0F2F85
MKKFLLLIFMVIAIGVAVGIYRFNFTDDDIYVVQADGNVVPLDTNSNSSVMLTLFNFHTDKDWDIQVPESEAKAPLTELKEYGDTRFAIGKYHDGEENGVVSLDYTKITNLNFGSSKNEMFFAAPFAVSNQGSGIFWYLGLFKLDTKTADIHQIDTLFLGDRIKIKELKVDEPFDVTSSLYVAYFKHSQKQSFSEAPDEKVEKRINVSVDGFSK